MRKRIFSLLLSAAMLLAPAASFAESSYDAGTLSGTAISESYVAGNQINLDVVFGLDAQRTFAEKRLQAAANLLSRAQLHMSFYDDFGTARVHAALDADGVELLTVDMLVYEDGAVQIMSNLTGKLVLALPAGSVVDGRLQLSSLTDTDAEYDFETKEGRAAFNALPARTRLFITGNDMISTLINHLLGWVSYMQMDNDGEFYVFDDTYLEATDTRDPVAQRMLGTIKADSFTTLFWNITMTIADEKGDFQQALADVLAELGVTRYQVRQVVDALLTEETIDPAVDCVAPSHTIADDGALCDYDDVSYFFKKLAKSADRIWKNSTDSVLRMDVSYDDFGGMVGFDAELAKFTEVLPYEGTFVYSIRTDDNWQRLHTSHGELQIDADNRVTGDLNIQFGEDIDGVNTSSFAGQADVVSRKDGTSCGVGVDAGLTFAVQTEDDGRESETFEGSAVLSAREGGTGKPVLAATFSGVTMVDSERFDLLATAALEAEGYATLVADVTLAQADYEEIPFAGGQAIDLTALDDAALETIRSEYEIQKAKLGLSLVAYPGLLMDLMTLFVK